MFALLKLAAFIQELLPLAHLAVMGVQALSPQGISGAAKFNAAVKAVNDTVNAATTATDTFVQVKTAIDAGDGAAVALATQHAIEVALSISKTFGLFPKAAIVQSALPLGDVKPEQPPG